MRDSRLSLFKENRKLISVFALVVCCIAALIFLYFFPYIDDLSSGKDEFIYVTVSDSGRVRGGFNIFPYHDEKTDALYFFLPGEEKNSHYKINFVGAKSVKINDDVYSYGNELDNNLILNYEDIAGANAKGKELSGNQYSITMKDRSVKSGEIYFLCAGNVDTLYVVSGQNEIDRINEDPSHKLSDGADLTVYGSNNAKKLTSRIEISGHGNSTWSELMTEFPGEDFKRSYNISFGEKKSILGMSASSSYVLTSNYYDESEIKNFIALETARSLDMKNVPECEYANLYVNGQYRGLYLVIQKIKEGNGFLDLESGGYLAKFDYEERVKTEDNVWVEANNKYAKVLFPKKDDPRIKDDITRDIERIDAAIKDKSEELTDLVDMESFVQYYLIQEFFENGDADRASQYFYKDGKNGKVTAGPIWDIDLSMGHPWFSYDGSEKDAMWIKGLVAEDGWLRELSDNDAFMGEVYTYYKNSFSDAVGYAADKKLPEVADKIGSSWYMDMLRYRNCTDYYDKFDYSGHGTMQYDQSAIVGDVREWILDRKQFLDDYVTSPESYEEERHEPGENTRSIRELIILKKK